MTNLANVAATFHRRMVDDERFGYTQGGARWGGNGTLEKWECDGVTGLFIVGDRDCSSSVIDVWNEALRGSAYEGALSAANYTGNMRSVFVNSGLFEWHPMGDGYIAQRGDIYLNEANHTALCQSAIPDMLTEFLYNESGGIVGGQTGDQTGGESIYRAYYGENYWNGILAYNHAADTDTTTGWIEDSSGRVWYKNDDGSWPANEWKYIEDNWYFFDDNGYMSKSTWRKDGENWGYCKSTGIAARNEWLYIEDAWYYFNDHCHMIKNKWIDDNGTLKYLKNSGKMAQNELLPLGEDASYIFDERGRAIKINFSAVEDNPEE